jgi:GNAT superfamily N-acetyltransferase
MFGAITAARIRVEPLDRNKHDRAAFTCGETTLDNYLKNTAARQQQQNMTRVKVGCPDALNDVMSFYAMNAHSLDITTLSTTYQKMFPRYDAIPSVYLSMLGVHVKCQGCGVGSYMMADAMKQVLSVSEYIGVKFLVLDALNARAAALYQRLGFERLSSISERMIMSTEKIKLAVAAVG